MTIPEEMMAFYKNGKEAERLFQGLGLIEFARMQQIMGRFFPAAPASVVDVGGGPGTYASRMAMQGYQVHLENEPVHSPHMVAVGRKPGSR